MVAEVAPEDRWAVHGLREAWPPSVWCGLVGWSVASMDSSKVTCPRCEVERGLAEWRME